MIEAVRRKLQGGNRKLDGLKAPWARPVGGGARRRAGRGRIAIALDDRRAFLDLEEGVRAKGTRLDRFGIVTSWIDGNRQEVFWDDLEYTVRQ